MSWLADPEAKFVDAFMLKWTDFSCYLFPPCQPDITLPTKISLGKSGRCLVYRSHVANPTVVQSVGGNLGGGSSLATRQHPFLARDKISNSATNQGTASGVSLLEQSVNNQGISEGAANLILESWSKGTKKQ